MNKDILYKIAEDRIHNPELHYQVNPVLQVAWGNPSSGFLKGRRQGSWLNGDKKRLFTPAGSTKTYRVTDSMIPAHKAGREINSGLGALNNEQIINHQAQDPNFFRDSIQHYNSIPQDFWNKIGITYRRDNLGRFPKYIPTPKRGAAAKSQFSPTTSLLGNWNNLYVPNKDQHFSDKVLARMVGLSPTMKTRGTDVEGEIVSPYVTQISEDIQAAGNNIPTFGIKQIADFKRRYFKKPVEPKFDVTEGVHSNGRFTLDAPYDALSGMVAGHEIAHESNIGSGKAVINPFTRSKDIFNIGAFPVIRDNRIPTLLELQQGYRYNGIPSMAFAPQGSTEEQAIQIAKDVAAKSKNISAYDGYTMNIPERTQAMHSYNRYRNALRNKIMEDRQLYINGGFEPETLDYIVNMPKFYSDSEEDRTRFANDMLFWEKHPEATELLGSEGRRVIPGYLDVYHKIQNINKRLPKEKNPRVRKMVEQDRLNYQNQLDDYLNRRVITNRANSQYNWAAPYSRVIPS